MFFFYDSLLLGLLMQVMKYVDIILVFFLFCSTILGKTHKLASWLCSLISFITATKLYIFLADFIFFTQHTFFKMCFGFLIIFFTMLFVSSNLCQLIPEVPVFHPLSKWLGWFFGFLRGVVFICFLSQANIWNTLVANSIIAPYLVPAFNFITYFMRNYLLNFIQDNLSPILSSYLNLSL